MLTIVTRNSSEEIMRRILADASGYDSLPRAFCATRRSGPLERRIEIANETGNAIIREFCLTQVLVTTALFSDPHAFDACGTATASRYPIQLPNCSKR